MLTPQCRDIPLLNNRWLSQAIAIGVFAIAATFVEAPASAQSRDVAPLVTTIDRLERQLQALERTVYRGAPPPTNASGSALSGQVPPAAVSQLQLKSGQLEEQMRALTGQVEEMGFKMNQFSDRLDRLVADMDFRLRTLEGTDGQAAPLSGATAPAVRAPSRAAVAPRTAPSVGSVTINRTGTPGPSRVFGTLTESQLKAADISPTGAGEGANGQIDTQQATANAGDGSGLPPGSPQERYQYARDFLMRRDFDGAEQALQAFVDTYPENNLSGSAQYWLGETHYVRKDYSTAARTFADGFQRYPDSNKAPDNLLKLGMSLAALDRTEDACITLNKLLNEYPKSSASIKQVTERERTRLKCS